MNSIKTIISMIESKAIDDGLKFRNQINAEAQCKVGSEVMKSEFEKAYEPNPHKSPFTEVRFNEEKQIYEPLNPSIDHVARSLNAAWYGYRIRQTEVDELKASHHGATIGREHHLGKIRNERDDLQKRLDAALKLIPSLKSENDLWGCDQVERQIELLEQALKGG